MSVAMLLGIAACSDEKKAETPAPAAETTQTPPAAESTAPKSEPAAEAKPAEAAPERSIETVTNEACLKAVSKETNESDVAVMSNEFSEANTLVMVGVGAQRAPWKCLVSKDGTVAEVSFTGNDGDGVAETPAPQPSGSEVSGAAQTACMEAVKKETGESNVAVLSTEFSEANSMVMVGVGADRAPWKCLVSNDGVVAEVSSATDEGAL